MIFPHASGDELKIFTSAVAVWGLQNRKKALLLVTMAEDAAEIRRKVAAHRERVKAAGRVFVNTSLPAELVIRLDQIKEAKGASSRAPLIEEAVRLLIEKKQGA